MAASIGHELNQPLTAILTNAQLVKRGLQTGRLTTDAALPFLEKIEYNTQRASGILERIRSFMRTGTVHRDQVNLHEVVNSVLQLMEADLASHSVGIELSAMDMPLYVSGDALELSQVTLNLMKNAVESMSGTSERSIQIGLDMVDGNARIRVRDSGPGLNEEQNAKAGTPFFTTKQQGLGMGLAISRSIVRKHGGALTLTNADDGGCSGALAMVALPMAQEVK
jgi:C4-dicarboxylate-specific signal transduction histidine kinase